MRVKATSIVLFKIGGRMLRFKIGVHLIILRLWYSPEELSTAINPKPEYRRDEKRKRKPLSNPVADLTLNRIAAIRWIVSQKHEWYFNDIGLSLSWVLIGYEPRQPETFWPKSATNTPIVECVEAPNTTLRDWGIEKAVEAIHIHRLSPRHNITYGLIRCLTNSKGSNWRI